MAHRTTHAQAFVAPAEALNALMQSKQWADDPTGVAADAQSRLKKALALLDSLPREQCEVRAASSLHYMSHRAITVQSIVRPAKLFLFLKTTEGHGPGCA